MALVAVAGGAWWVGASTQSPEQAAARSKAPEPSWITARVELRQLSASIVARGVVEPDCRTAVGVPSSVVGQAILTQKPVDAGDIINEGDLIAEVSGRPIFVLQGEATFYRTLTPGMEGNDVSTLQTALLRLSYDIPDEEVGSFGAATKAAIYSLYGRFGYSPVDVSAAAGTEIAAAERLVNETRLLYENSQQQLLEAPIAPPRSAVLAADASVAAAERFLDAAISNEITDVRLAEQALGLAREQLGIIRQNPEATAADISSSVFTVASAEAALAATVRNAADVRLGAQADLDVARASRVELLAPISNSELETTVASNASQYLEAMAAYDRLVAENGPTIPFGEIVLVPEMPARVLPAESRLDQTNASDLGDSSRDIASIACGDLVVVASVLPEHFTAVREGLSVSVLDDAAGKSYSGELASIDAALSVSAAGRSGHSVIIELAQDVPDSLSGASVRLQIDADATEQPEFVVPIAAVSSTPDGTTRVSVLDEATGQPRDIPVEVGLSAGGFIVIQTEDLTIEEGTLVVVGR